jgi:glycosyltransferase involved in cell wall biosynthesis
MAKIASIAVDARTLTFQETGERGIGTYTTEHVYAWASACPQISFKLLTESGSEFVRGSKLLSLPNISRDFYSLSQTEFSNIDLFHVPDPMSMIEGYDSPFRMAPSGVKASILFHDLIPLALRNSVYDKWHKNIQRAYDVRLQHVKDSKALILANSEATKRDLVSLANVETDRISVVMAGLSKRPIFQPSQDLVYSAKLRLGVNKPFLLVVGGLDEHKGFLHTLEASFDLLKSKQMQIIIVGSMIDPWKLQLREALSRKNIEGVIFTGFIADEDLACLYSDAIALVFPSEYEGFGFPVLEAMAHACPVICSNRASLPEVAGDAAVYLEELSSAAIFNAVRRLLQDSQLRTELKLKGPKRAEIFSWSEVASRSIEAIEQYKFL